MTAVSVVAETGTAGPVLELLDDRAGQAPGTFSLQGGMSDVVVVLQHLLDLADDLSLAQPEFRLDVDVGRKRRDMGADGPDVQMVDVVDPVDLPHFRHHIVDIDVAGDALQ